jgi:hypothetical protein
MQTNCRLGQQSLCPSGWVALPVAVLELGGHLVLGCSGWVALSVAVLELGGHLVLGASGALRLVGSRAGWSFAASAAPVY